MTLIEIIVLSIALSLDASAVSLSSGVKMHHFIVKKALIFAFAFGFFQALMPILGYFLGEAVAVYIDKYSSPIVCVILAFIGGKMIVDAIREKDDDFTCIKDCDHCVSKGKCKIIRIDYKELLLLAISTSIDAFAVGVTFSLLRVNLIASVAIIGIVTFVMCFVSVWIGSKFGEKYKKLASIIGGIVLIAIGLRVVIA